MFGNTFSMHFTTLRQVNLALVSVGELLKSYMVVVGFNFLSVISDGVKNLVDWLTNTLLLTEVYSGGLGHKVDFFLVPHASFLHVKEGVARGKTVVFRMVSSVVG
jgi:hypothetical protein